MRYANKKSTEAKIDIFYPCFNKTTYYLAKYNDRKCFNTLFASKGNYNFQDLLYSEFSI